MTSEQEGFKRFFRTATSFNPYCWQKQVAAEGLPDILPIPTGFGKTEGSVLAWAWRRFAQRASEPLHLVYCLPMRTLVSQTTERLRICFAKLKEWDSAVDVPVYQLIGGDADSEWASQPDRPWVLVGTQDMLLSRALNRGYGMHRFDWPVHFGILNQDCHWIIDEVQLMGPGLWTTAQLDWMRRYRFPALKACRSTWMSATVGAQFLQTTDRRASGCDTAQPFHPDLESDSNEEFRRRRVAHRAIKLHEAATAKKAISIVEQIACAAEAAHVSGTLTLIVCNTVKTAQDVFQRLGKDGPPKVLLTSRFRANDRRQAEEALRTFETRRSAADIGRVEDHDPGLICVSTQVVEAGLDISAHQLWTEHAPWPSLIQRLGRLNRDGKDNEACATVWKLSPESKRKYDDEEWIGPYRKAALDQAWALLDVFAPLSQQRTAAAALDELERCLPKQIAQALAIAPAPCPRAIDVHGLFSTEADLYGGFTDVSRFVRDTDPDPDVIVFWRDWRGSAPPSGDALDGLPVDLEEEACAVPAEQLRGFLKAAGARALLWDDRADRWDALSAQDLCPGMMVMLRADVGGYSQTMGWTGSMRDRLSEVAPPGPGRSLRDDHRSESGYWASLASHLADARGEADQICAALTLDGPVRTAVIEAAGLHDLGKAHPDWQAAIERGGPLDPEALAKFPKVLRVEVARPDVNTVKCAVEALLGSAIALTDEIFDEGRIIRLRWALEHQLERSALESIRALASVRWARHKAFAPGLRHEAASALAMWRHYREAGTAPYPALAVYLAAAHHGKVRTVMRAITQDGEDVFGVARSSAALQFAGREWPMDFSVAFDGAEGTWTNDGFELLGPGWTGIVADLLGSWRREVDAGVGAVPDGEPRSLGPFVLAWLEALVRVADWRASGKPSQPVYPEAAR